MTKLYFNIAILDNNPYFSQGMKILIEEHFQRKGWVANFLPPLKFYKADLVILEYGYNRSFRCYCGNENETEKKVIIIRDSTPSGQRFADFSRIHNVISRRISCAFFLNLVENVLTLQEASKPFYSLYPCCTKSLTRREREVLSAMSQGLTPDDIATQIGINAKTVFLHKYFAMRKLGFQRSNELYIWLLKGGLRHCHKQAPVRKGKTVNRELAVED